MIEPMKKVSIVLLNKEKETALKSLRKIGLVHLEKVEGSSEKLSGFKEISNNALISESILGEIKVSKKSKNAESDNISNEEIIKLCSEIVAKAEKKKQLMEEISNDTTELDRFSNWGEVENSDFDYLAGKGIKLKMFEVPADKYHLIDEQIQTLLVNKDKKTVRFMIINGGEGRPDNLIPEAFEVTLPRISTILLKKEIAEDNAQLQEIEAFFVSNAKYLNAIGKLKKDLEVEIEFENINAGMEHEKDGSVNELAWISGYVPVANMDGFKSACKQNNWALASDDPDDEDLGVPTKLKNNKFVSLIYPLTDFLGTVPGYHEYDISGWFLLFFTIFFGMIFGDGGYGLLVTVVALLAMLKNAAAKKPFSPMLGLVTLVGFATVIWGLVTCTWFGLTPEQLPLWLVNLSVQPISNAADFMNGGKEYLLTLPWTDKGLTTGQNLQIFCFTLALLQLSVAHVKGISRNLKEHSLKFVGELGSLLQLWGMFYVVLSMVVSSDIFPLDLVVNGIPVATTCIGLVGGGFALSFIFANYEGNIVKSILESCKNIISVLLGVVNVFSDIVSYIRLWAVGLAGAAISNTVNTMAGPLLGHAIMFVAAIALLVFGHGLNMILNLLSVIVHGVRLNTLEFSSHLGMSWSGFKYQPFAEKGKA